MAATAQACEHVREAAEKHNDGKARDFAFYRTNPQFLGKYFRILVRRSTKIKAHRSVQLVVQQTTQNVAFYPHIWLFAQKFSQIFANSGAHPCATGTVPIQFSSVREDLT